MFVCGMIINFILNEYDDDGGDACKLRKLRSLPPSAVTVMECNCNILVLRRPTVPVLSVPRHACVAHREALERLFCAITACY